MMPLTPFVSPSAFSMTSAMMTPTQSVKIANTWPRSRSETSPTTAPAAAATTPPAMNAGQNGTP